MKETKLSVVLATLNEEKNLGDCLQSVKLLADEIIVVDGDSQDKTRKIAREYGAKVFRVTNKPIFHINKQLAVDKARSEWVLQLDADERVSEDLGDEIEKETNKNKNSCQGYYIPRKNWFLGRFLMKGGQYPDYVIRLFKRGKGKFPAKTVHEQILISGEIGYLKNPLIHLADPNFSRYLLRFNRYTDLDANLLWQKGVRPGCRLGIEYLLGKPLNWFFMSFFRHKGFLDGFSGFVFALMSSLRFPVIFLKLIEINTSKQAESLRQVN